MDNSSRFYNNIYPLYPLVDYFFRSQKVQLANIINQLPDGNLLEIGVGNGSMLPLYQKHIITGIDLSVKMLTIAKRRKSKVRVHLFIADGTDMKFQEDSFDYAVINHVLSVTQQPEAMLHEAYRVLKPNGQLFIINHFTPENALKYMDRLLHPVARLMKFRTYFFEKHLRGLQNLKPSFQIESKPFGYFKILGFKK